MAQKIYKFEVLKREADWYHKIPSGVAVLLTIGGKEFGSFKNTGFSRPIMGNVEIRAIKAYLLRAARKYFGDN